MRNSNLIAWVVGHEANTSYKKYIQPTTFHLPPALITFPRKWLTSLPLLRVNEFSIIPNTPQPMITTMTIVVIKSFSFIYRNLRFLLRVMLLSSSAYSQHDHFIQFTIKLPLHTENTIKLWQCHYPTLSVQTRKNSDVNWCIHSNRAVY